MTDFITKDSGERAQFESGMQRDTENGKARFDLIVPLDVPYEEQLLTRVAALLGRGAEKYTERNWEQATGQAELARFKSSAYRHFMQWLTGETDEDHAAAVVFNLLGHETTAYKMRQAEEANFEERAAELLGDTPPLKVGVGDIFMSQDPTPRTVQSMDSTVTQMRDAGIFLADEQPGSGRVERGWGDIPFGTCLLDRDGNWWVMDGVGRYGWRLLRAGYHHTLTRDLPQIDHGFGIRDDDGEYGIVDPIWGFIPWGASVRDEDPSDHFAWWFFAPDAPGVRGNPSQCWRFAPATHPLYHDLTLIDGKYGIRNR